MAADVPASSVGTPRARLVEAATSLNQGAFTALDWGLFVAIGTIWGSSFLLIDVGLDAMEPGLITLGRVGLGALVLAVLPAARAAAIAPSDHVRLVLLSILWVALPFTLFPLAEQHVSSAVAGMLNGSVPLFATVFAAVLVRHHPGAAQLLGLVVGLAGVICISASQAGDGDSALFGVVLVLIACLCYGYAVNLAAPLQQRYGSVPLMSRMLALATLWTLPFGLWSVQDSHAEALPIAAVAVLGAVGTGLAFVVMGTLVGRVGSTRASFITYLVPVVALILGVVVRDDDVTPLAVGGVGLVIVGAVLASRQEAGSPTTPRTVVHD